MFILNDLQNFRKIGLSKEILVLFFFQRKILILTFIKTRFL